MGKKEEEKRKTDLLPNKMNSLTPYLSRVFCMVRKFQPGLNPGSKSENHREMKM